MDLQLQLEVFNTIQIKFFSSPQTVIDPATGTADFSATITGLTACTTYWFRAYATNSIGTTYANKVSATTTGCTAAPFPITTDSYTSSSSACLQGTLQSTVYFEGDTFATGKVAYTDTALSNPFIGDGDWYNINTATNGATATRVSSTGVVGPIASICSIQP